MVDIVLTQAHIPPRSPIRVRDQKCWHGRKRWQRITCHPCEPQVTSMSIGSVCMLIGFYVLAKIAEHFDKVCII